MYGILLESLMQSIIEDFGQPLWEQIQEYLNLDGNQILTNNTYPDVIFTQIIDALITFRHEGSYEYYMEFFGNRFVSFFSNYGFEKILRVAGRSYRDFLHSIDQLHESNRFTFPKMKSPLFFVSDEDPYGVYLHYQTRRRGFNWYVIGQLKEVARAFYKLIVNVRIYQDLSDDEFNHVVFRVDFDNLEYLEVIERKHDMVSENSALFKVMPDVMLNLFPFAFGVDEGLTIQYVGSAFENLFVEDITGQSMYNVFDIVRPSMKVDWHMMLIHQTIIFEYENVMPLKYSKSADIKLLLKGQMKLFKEFNLIFFLGHPVLTRMHELHDIGLYLNDLNKFDGSAEMLVTELQHNDQLQKAFDAQQAFFEKLQQARVELNTWKRKGKKLLYSMLPAKIARKIENGVEPNTICETYEECTIMFANTADFKTIIKNLDIEPMQIIDFINTVVFLYDKVVSTYDRVHKIETKADGSYMVVAGIDQDPEKDKVEVISQKTSSMSLRTGEDDGASAVSQKRAFPQYNQVELVGSVALEILERRGDFQNPFDPTVALQIQIGIHTGQIVAGIVGLSNIQFCLFGDSVNTSSRMCSNSEAGRVLISESSYEFLKESNYFYTELRDTIKVKGKGQMKVYWLSGRKQDDPFLQQTGL